VRYRAALLGLVLLAAGCGGGGGAGKTTSAAPPKPSVNVVLKGLPAHPKASVNLPYSVTATDSSGKRVSGKLTVQIVDPLGNAHAVTYDNTKRPIKNFPFHGAFHDYLAFPKDAVGYPLTVRAKVTSAQGDGTATFRATPKL
jgi:hypothetical protein